MVTSKLLGHFFYLFFPVHVGEVVSVGLIVFAVALLLRDVVVEVECEEVGLLLVLLLALLLELELLAVLLLLPDLEILNDEVVYVLALALELLPGD